MILGLVGFIGSGKNTVGNYLVSDHGFSSTSFAGTLKDSVSSMFSWPRHLLEGDTEESREWREKPDPWWTKKFGRPVTPRWVLQYIGTDVMRIHFNPNIWIWSVEKKLVNSTDNIVITDVRFGNEIKMIRDIGGKIVWVRKSELPEWYDMAHAANSDTFLHAPEAHDEMVKLGVHPSEWSWVGSPIDETVFNDKDLKTLYRNVDKCLKNLI